MAEFDGGEVEGGADDELGAFEDAGTGGFGVEDGAGAEEEFGAVVGEAAEEVDGAGDGHGDLEDVDAAGGDGVDELEGVVFGVGAEDGRRPVWRMRARVWGLVGRGLEIV